MDLISTVDKRATFSTPGVGIYSPLSTALFYVLLHAGSDGLSVCEALRKLVRQGYSKLLNSNIHMRALQVKSALRGCPAFKELESRKFILRFNKEDEKRNNHILLSKLKNYHGKKQGKASSGEKVLNVEGSCSGPTASSEREQKSLNVGGSCNGPTASPERGQKGLNLEESCNGPAASPERGLCVESPFNQPEIVPDKGLQMVVSGDKDTLSNISPSEKELLSLGSCCTPTVNNAVGHSLDGRKNERVEGHCMSDDKHWGCIQHTSLGSLYSDHSNQSMTGDGGENIFSPQGKEEDDLSGQMADDYPKDNFKLGRCRRTDGKRWQCSKQVQLGSIYCEHHHIVRKKGKKAKVVDAFGRVVRAAARTRFPSSIRPSESFVDEHAIKEEEGIQLEPLMNLANLSACVSAAQSAALSVEETIPEVQETKSHVHMLDLEDDVQRSKKKPKVAGHGQLVMVEGAVQEGQKETEPDPHGSLEVEGESKPYLHASELHDLEDVQRSMKAPEGAGLGQLVMLEKAFHEGQEKTETDLMQGLHEASMPSTHGQSVMLEAKREVLETDSSFEGAIVVYKGEGPQAELLGPKEKSQVVAKMPCLFLEDFKKRLLDLGVSSSEGRVFLDKALDASTRCFGPKESTDAHMQCHRHNGKGWQCSRQCKPGYMYCEHHQGRLSKRKSSSNSKRKVILQLELDKGNSDMQVLRVAIDVPQSLVKGLKAKVTQGNQDEGTLLVLERCHRKDGKGWQCAQQCKLGSIYCDRHQRSHHKGRYSSDSQQKLALSREPDHKHVKDMHVDTKQPSQSAVDAVLEETLEPKVEGQRVEDKSCRQDDMGVQSSSGATPVLMDLVACCLGEKNTTSGKAEVNVKKCQRRDGKKWQCSRQCMPGYNHCEHHQGRGRRVKLKTSISNCK
eukprot:c24526_g1_i1 orf=179-2884(-)